MKNAECWPDAGTVVAFSGILHSAFFILHSPKVVARWRRWDTTLGLKIARTLTQGSLADSVAGLEDTIPLGLQPSGSPSFHTAVASHGISERHCG